eukprot:GHVN01020270.1.p1 GENE.GHVN01020270.1~~GHVN01020270.1.p1  ORF type:complete len:437 (+),score=73.46 GHVN01020270.1:648-1958(+)
MRASNADGEAAHASSSSHTHAPTTPIVEPPKIVISYTKLPKGTFARFIVLDEVMPDGTYDVKSTLEYSLRMNHTVLTVGDIFMIDLPDGLVMKMLVSHLEPASAVSVIDTDIEVDIVHHTSPQPPGLNDAETHKDSGDIVHANSKERDDHRDPASDGSVVSSSFHEELIAKGTERRSPSNTRPLSLHKTLANLSVDGNEHVDFKASISADDKAMLMQGAALSVECFGVDPPGGADLHVSFPPLRGASEHRNHFAVISSEADKVILVTSQHLQEAMRSHQSSHTNFEDLLEEMPRSRSRQNDSIEWPPVMFVGVTGCAQTGSTSYSLRVSISNHTETNTNANTSDSPPHEATALQTKYCDSCHRQIAIQSYELHVVHCARFCTVCNVCGVVLKRSHADQHVHCEDCGEAMDVSYLPKVSEYMYKAKRFGAAELLFIT